MDAGYCGMHPSRSSGLIYTIAVVGHKPVTLLTCNDGTDVDKKSSLSNSIVGKCVDGNVGNHNYVFKSRVTFNTSEIETYIFYVTVYEYIEGRFTLSVKSAASSRDKSKTKIRIGVI